MSETILAVDDDIDILELIQMSLAAEGFDVITANDGMSGLEKARAHSPDLILLDLMMPVMDGFEVIGKLKADEQTRAIPVIMLTARAQTHERVQGLHAGADDYVTKPFDLDELTARIEAVLGRTLPTKYINPLISTMGDWFTEEGVEQLASHLEAAAMIQQNLIPKKAPNLPGFDIAGFLRSSMTVSGDFYDFIPLDNNRLGIAIADVRGKGIPAALLMVMIRTILRLICREETSPAAVLKRINDLLAIDTEPDLFATMVYGILDSTANTFTYSSAGHCYPLHLKNGGREVDELKEGGMLLGTFEHAAFESETIPLAPGDELLLYTDGVTEAERKSDETFYGEERLVAILESNSHQPAETFCQTIETALFDFSGTDHRDDDVTIVVIKATDGKE